MGENWKKECIPLRRHLLGNPKAASAMLTAVAKMPQGRIMMTILLSWEPPRPVQPSRSKPRWPSHTLPMPSSWEVRGGSTELIRSTEWPREGQSITRSRAHCLGIQCLCDAAQRLRSAATWAWRCIGMILEFQRSLTWDPVAWKE